MLLAAVAVSLITAIALAARDAGGLNVTLGDTDDAMRLVLMRALAGGQGWFDQNVARLQPPRGVFMHWSRLVDGGLAGLDALFRLGLPPARAELATRFTWPLLWILPTAWAGMAVARRLGGGAAVFACAIIMAVNLPMFLQFRPGRIDHHNLQIALAMLTLAGAALGTVRGALLAGAATGLGMAIGLEALVFEVVVGAFFALCYLIEEDDGGRKLRTYAGALGLTAVGFFLVQTPPSRWGVGACDAVAVNLVAAVATAAIGLVAAVQLTRRRDWRFRLGAVAAVGAVGVAVYVGLDPHCLGGPFADVDPRLKVFWLPNVQEIRPIPRVWRRNHETVFVLMAPWVLGLLAAAWLGRSEKRRADPFLVLTAACLLVAMVCGWNAVRMAGYAGWFAVPLIAAAVAGLTARWFGGTMLAAAAAACLATPIFLSAAATRVDKQVKAMTAPKAKAPPVAKAKAPPKPAIRGDRCFRTAAYAELAAQPPGVVLSEVDLGPFILAHTGSSAMAAPYHRMNWGLVEARAALSMEAEAALAGVRRLGAAYVLECPSHARNADRVGMAAGSLQKRLDANKPPSWLEPVGAPGVLRLYRVRPAAGGAPAPAAAP